jgi:alanine dehydrogenase
MLNSRITIGVPKELKNNEYRVAMIPEQVKKLTIKGNKVFVGKHAGELIGFTDNDYKKAGAIIVDNFEVYNESDLIVKVKEPVLEEYKLINAGQIIFTYFHFASSKKLTDAMKESGAICIAYETIVNNTTGHYNLPLLAPMSEIAGLLAVQQGMKFLEKPFGGSGILLSGTNAIDSGKIVIIGGGVAGIAAAKLASRIGAQVYILDISEHRVNELQNSFIGISNINIILLKKKEDLEEYLYIADIIIGAVLIPGAETPKLITKNMIKKMKKGSVVVDISIDQGGISEVSEPTTHTSPIFKVDGVIFYCVTNMPGAVPLTSTEALSKATFPYIEKLVNDGWKEAVRNDYGLLCGINIAYGHVCNKGLSDLFEYDYYDPMHLLH